MPIGISFSVLGHKNDNEAIACSIQQRRNIQRMENVFTVLGLF